MARNLEVELGTLFEATGASTLRSVHLLLYQVGARHRSPLEAARRLFAGQVDSWIEVVDPRSSDSEPRPEDVLFRKRQPLGQMRSVSFVIETPRRFAALAASGAKARRSRVPPLLGVIFGASSAALRSIENPTTLLDSESTWEHHVAAAFRAKFGVEPAANICVYREADIQELGARLDPLTTVLGLIRTHPHVAVEEASGAVTAGPAAIETIVAAARPAGVSSETWQILARAAGLGLARRVTPPNS